MITIIPSDKQVHGAFDNNRILERKPIGFPQEGGIIAPYSILFYWAFAWSDKGGVIGEHPHKGFEIMSYIIEGEIEHFDNKMNGWKKLKTGDVQIIRSGNGITHAERFLPGGKFFQIWFDPDLNKTIAKPATYNDYPAEIFPEHKEQGCTTKQIFGGTPFVMDSKVDSIQRITFTVPEKSYPLSGDSIYSFFILEGAFEVNENKMEKGDFAILKEETSMRFNNIKSGTEIFIIKTPLNPGHPLYADYMSH